MTQETLKMSRKERERLIIMRQYQDGEIQLKEAAWKMRVSVRQAIRIKKRFESRGAGGLIHRARDMPSNNALPSALKARVLALYRDQYDDYGPTLASEKMAERDDLVINHETLRLWLIADGQWRVGQKARTHRKHRKRRERFGMMIQIDGCEHDWFEGRGPKAMLMVMVDDATGRIMLYMAAAETTVAALTVLKKWVKRYGTPVSLYADRRSLYFTQDYLYSPQRRDDPQTWTQFMHCTQRLGIEMIPAWSAQAKGRVERINGILQDRLVKEMRLEGVCSIEEANAMLDRFAQDYNRRFAREPLHQADAHRLAPAGRAQWERCFCLEETRTVQRDNTVSYKAGKWQILPQDGSLRPGRKVTLRAPIGNVRPYWLYGEKRLKTHYLEENHKSRHYAGASPRAPGI